MVVVVVVVVVVLCSGDIVGIVGIVGDLAGEHLDKRCTAWRFRLNRGTGGGDCCTGGRDWGGGGVTSSNLSSFGSACIN